jgi:hypothetical protein
MMNNILALSIRELILAFLFALAVVCPLQWALVFIGILASFQAAAAFKVSGILSLANLCVLLYHIKIFDDEETDE